MAEEAGPERLIFHPCEHLRLRGIVVDEPTIEVEIEYAGVTRRYGMYSWSFHNVLAGVTERVMSLDGVTVDAMQTGLISVTAYARDAFGNEYAIGFDPEKRTFTEI